MNEQDNIKSQFKSSIEMYEPSYSEFNIANETSENYIEEDESFDDFVMGQNFSNISGKGFRNKFQKAKVKAPVRKFIKGQPLKPLSKAHGISKSAVVQGDNQQIGKVIIPNDKKVIVEGVSSFILSKQQDAENVKNIGYYKGKKLKQLVLNFNNNSANNFELELFNPSMQLDYLHSTSLNLNDKIQVAGGTVQYSDVMFNLLANPAMIPNCKFVFSGPSLIQQRAIPLIFKDKEIQGTEAVSPLALNNELDTMQVASDIVFFDLTQKLTRPYVPDGMDVLGYTILPGMSISMCFYYKQVSMKKIFFKGARTKDKEVSGPDISVKEKK
tara:strand:- start:2569 stop:3549 length:981 start_codon:yes stop_codon:yes gene_type:complete